MRVQRVDDRGRPIVTNEKVADLVERRCVKRQKAVFILATVIAVSAPSVVMVAKAQAPIQSGAPDMGTDSNPVGPPGLVVSGNEALLAPTAPRVTGTPIYFTPQDENTSATILFLYNTNSVDKTVGLQSFFTNGSLTINTTIIVPAHGLVRVCSDTVNTISASWQHTVLINFTTFSAYAILTLPNGVKVDGYVAYVPSPPGTYDPLAPTQMLPLRFSVRSATVP